MLQYANAVLLFVFCILYSWSHGKYKDGLFAAVISLIFIYVYDRAPFLQYDRTVRKSFSALIGWFFSIIFLSFFSHEPLFHKVNAILFVLFIVLIVYYFRKISRECFVLALVFRGEPTYLKEIERYIQENFVRKSLVNLIDPTYSEEHLCIVDKSEWRSLTEFREKGLLSQSREGEPTHEDVAFFLLRGERRHLEEIRNHIVDEYLSNGFIRLFDSVYLREKMHAVKELE